MAKKMISSSSHNRRIVIIPYLWDQDKLRVAIMSSQKKPQWHFFSVRDNGSCDMRYLSKKIKDEAGLIGVFESEPFIDNSSLYSFQESKVYAFEVTELLDGCLNAPVNSRMMILDIDAIQDCIDKTYYFNLFKEYIKGKNIVKVACDEHVVIPYVWHDESINIILNDDGVSKKRFLSIRSARNIHIYSDDITYCLTEKIRKSFGLCGYVRMDPICFYNQSGNSSKRIYIYEMIVYDILEDRRCENRGHLEYVLPNNLDASMVDEDLIYSLQAHEPSI